MAISPPPHFHSASLFDLDLQRDEVVVSACDVEEVRRWTGQIIEYEGVCAGEERGVCGSGSGEDGAGGGRERREMVGKGKDWREERER